MSGCSVAANSASSDAIVIRSGVHSVTADTLVTPGQISVDGTSIDPTMLPPELGVTSPPMIGSADVKNPYARTLTHAFLSSGISRTPEPTNVWIGVSKTINPGCIQAACSLKREQPSILHPAHIM